MTDTTTLEAASGTSPRRSGALTAMRLAELQGLASSMGISGTAKMRKGDLVAAIKARQNGESGAAPERRRPSREPGRGRAGAPSPPRPPRDPRDRRAEQPAREERTRPSARHGAHPTCPQRAARTATERTEPRRERSDAARTAPSAPQQPHRAGRRPGATAAGPPGPHREPPTPGPRRRRTARTAPDGDTAPGRPRTRTAPASRRQKAGYDDEDGRGGRRRRNRRSQPRQAPHAAVRPATTRSRTPQPQIAEDDVLVPVAGILDVLDNYAFVRTTGYLPGPNDVYVPLRPWSSATACARATPSPARSRRPVRARSRSSRPCGRSNRAKFNALVRLDTINGQTAGRRPRRGRSSAS